MDLSTWSPEFDWENLTYKQQVEVLFVTYHLLYDLLDTVCSDDKLFTTPDKGCQVPLSLDIFSRTM